MRQTGFSRMTRIHTDLAVAHDGKRLWELGDHTIEKHRGDGAWNEPALRGIPFIYDINQDGKMEVVTEFWKDGKPWICVLEGNTGRVLEQRESPFDLDVRGGRRSRCHPVGRVAYPQGRAGKPAIVLKYGASNHVPCLAVALDAQLIEMWRLAASKHAMGHVPSVDDVDDDGRDEIIFGTLLADESGGTLWEKHVDRHADCTAIADVHPAPGRELLVSVCSTGPAYCLAAEVLDWGETKSHLAVQAFAVDLCADSREELVLYQPYNGKAILIFTQPDSDGAEKPYVHEKDAYNIRSYF